MIKTCGTPAIDAQPSPVPGPTAPRQAVLDAHKAASLWEPDRRFDIACSFRRNNTPPNPHGHPVALGKELEDAAVGPLEPRDLLVPAHVGQINDAAFPGVVRPVHLAGRFQLRPGIVRDGSTAELHAW